MNTMKKIAFPILSCAALFFIARANHSTAVLRNLDSLHASELIPFLLLMVLLHCAMQYSFCAGRAYGTRGYNIAQAVVLLLVTAIRGITLLYGYDASVTWGWVLPRWALEVLAILAFHAVVQAIFVLYSRHKAAQHRLATQ